MAVVTERPDDRSGCDFRKLLSLVGEEENDTELEPGQVPKFAWVDRPRGNLGGAVRCAEAEWSVFDLLVVEMGEAILSRAPFVVPRISWSLQDVWKDDNEAIGGPAPSFDDAKLRAELALRVLLSVEMIG